MSDTATGPIDSPAGFRAAILADGDAPDRAELDAAWPGWDEGLALVVAADGGARHATGLGVRIDRWVGDGDSLPAAALAELRAAGVPVELVAAEKDETDTELALRAAVEAGATDVVILGAFGGPRLDHALANVRPARPPVARRPPGPAPRPRGRASGCCAVRRRSRSTVAPATSSRSSRSAATPTA